MALWSLLKLTIFVVLGALAVQYFFGEVINTSKSHGHVDHRFASIRKIALLKHESEGLALAVYVKNELVVDLWGGYAEKAAWRSWDEETMSIAYSTTKAIGALIIATLVSRGHMKYEDPVIKYWPEFGQRNKENITVEWLIAHKTGLIAFGEDFPLEKGHDHRHISRIIEESSPHWPAGTQIGYHAITHGYLLDQLVRRVDPKHRSIGEFYRQEIQAKSKSNDFFIGLPPAEEHRMARIASPNSIADGLKLLFTEPMRFMLFFMSGNLLKLTAGYPKFLSILEIAVPYNNPKVHQHENVAALGIGTARGLASVVNTVIQGKMISDDVWKRISRPDGATIFDAVLGMPGDRGYGFMYQKHPLRKEDWFITHPGHGGQKLDIFPQEQVIIALLRNGLHLESAAFDSTADIRRKVLKILENKPISS